MVSMTFPLRQEDGAAQTVPCDVGNIYILMSEELIKDWLSPEGCLVRAAGWRQHAEIHISGINPAGECGLPFRVTL
jgi:hypothetical protein